MKVCIAGGGRVGRYLAQSLLTNHHSVVIIEPIEAQCRMLADSLDIPVICGDSISVDTLRTADVGSCNAFVAVTGSDEDNLVACQIAKREFGVDRTVARASNPKNRELLHTLGVDTVVCGTDNLSHILEREIETDTIRQLLSLGGGTASLNEILLPENFLYAGKAIMDIPIPGDTILIEGGMPHAIGAGCFLAEIQETSDVTYRIYDFKRKDKDGNYRQLHTAEAAECIDYDVLPDYRTHYQPAKNEGVELVRCQHFTTSVYDIDEPMLIDYSELDSFVILIAMEGIGTLQVDGGKETSLIEGESVLIPATAKEVVVRGTVKFLETYA